MHFVKPLRGFSHRPITRLNVNDSNIKKSSHDNTNNCLNAYDWHITCQFCFDITKCHISIEFCYQFKLPLIVIVTPVRSLVASEVHHIPHVQEKEQTSQYSSKTRQEAQQEARCQIPWEYVRIVYVPHGYDTLPEAILIVGDDLLVVGLELMLELPTVILRLLPYPVYDSPCCTCY